MRKDDEKQNVHYFRTKDRLVRASACQWWFTTREGDEGPFHSRQEAEVALKRYVDAQTMLADKLAEQSTQRNAAQAKPIDPTIWSRQVDAL